MLLRLVPHMMTSLRACTLMLVLCGSAQAHEAPYNLSKFQSVLDDSKLQAPNSGTACAQGDFSGYADWFFRLDSTSQYMTFEMDGDKSRSELRQMEEWTTGTTSWRKMIGEVKVFYPTTSSLEQFTWMQIHDSTSLNKPLIRLTWRRYAYGQQDHLWAVVRDSANSSSSYSWFDLGARPSGFVKAEIKVKNNNLRVRIDSVTLVDIDVSYWDGLSGYYKAGVYLQDPGTAKVQFKSLKYYYQ